MEHIMDSFGVTGTGDGGGSSGLSSLNGQMGQLNAATAQFSKLLSTSLTQGISKGKSFEDILGNIGQKFRTMALNNANSAIEGGINTLFAGLMGGLGGFGGGGMGGVNDLRMIGHERLLWAVWREHKRANSRWRVASSE
jgi:hypothetical protein